jgi:hypothetical protein
MRKTIGILKRLLGIYPNLYSNYDLNHTEDLKMLQKQSNNLCIKITKWRIAKTVTYTRKKQRTQPDHNNSCRTTTRLNISQQNREEFYFRALLA